MYSGSLAIAFAVLLFGVVHTTTLSMFPNFSPLDSEAESGESCGGDSERLLLARTGTTEGAIGLATRETLTTCISSSRRVRCGAELGWQGSIVALALFLPQVFCWFAARPSTVSPRWAVLASRYPFRESGALCRRWNRGRMALTTVCSEGNSAQNVHRRVLEQHQVVVLQVKQ